MCFERLVSHFRILACLLVPVECLLPLDIMSQTDIGRVVVFELKSFLVQSKTIFQDPRSTRAILEFIKENIKLVSKEFEFPTRK